MRRILFTVLASAALMAAVPAAALAHDGHRGHHHKRHHHSRVRLLRFTAHRNDTSGGPSSSGSTSEPTAGMVTSFADNVLTITLSNGSTVTGDVTTDTEITCENPEMENGDNAADDNGGGDEHGDAIFDHGGDNGGSGDDGVSGDNQSCTVTLGMAVKKAELSIDGAGAFWNEVELISSSTSTSGS